MGTTCLRLYEAINFIPTLGRAACEKPKPHNLIMVSDTHMEGDNVFSASQEPGSMIKLQNLHLLAKEDMYKSPSKFASRNACGSRVSIPEFTSDMFELMGDKDLSAAVIGSVAHKADEFLIASGLFAKANAVTAEHVVEAVNNAYIWFRDAENMKDISLYLRANALGYSHVCHKCFVRLMDKYTKVILAMVARFVQIFNKVGRNLETELTMEGTSMGHLFRGTADIIEHNPDGTVTIWDVKHYRAPSEKDFNSFKIQTDIYSDLYEQTTGKKVSSTGVILPAQRLIQEDSR